MIKGNKKLTVALIIYYVLLFAVWGIFTLTAEKAITERMGDPGAEIFIQLVVKTIIWTVPALILIKHFDSSLEVPVKEMSGFRKGWKTFFIVFAAMTAYILILSFKGQNGMKISGNVPANILIFLFVGIGEEIVFRGWLLNASVRREKPAVPIAVNALMFLAIHFPKWIINGVFLSNMLHFGFVTIIVLSVLFSLVFLRTRNILIPVILHFWWDLLVTLLL